MPHRLSGHILEVWATLCGHGVLLRRVHGWGPHRMRLRTKSLCFLGDVVGCCTGTSWLSAGRVLHSYLNPFTCLPHVLVSHSRPLRLECDVDQYGFPHHRGFVGVHVRHIYSFVVFYATLSYGKD